MQSSLGLYIEDNLIKYAKVSKDNEVVKVESFGVKFYETLGPAIKQIVEETYSFKIPISINATDERYDNIEVFSMLSKKDIENVINTEFEHICYEKDINKSVFEQRYIIANSQNSNEKIKAIHISVPKTSIEQRKNQFMDYRISSIFPLSVSVENLVEKEKKATVLIVNIEKNTTITKIKNGSVSDIEILNVGSQDILNKINKKENSISKAYEICKSSTIYTEMDKDLQYEENEYLEDIMPTLYQIATQVRQSANESIEKIEKVYITGTGAIINNIDIYFQEYFKDIHCEILKPSFINNNSKINIKDYIEVNSAISIGLKGLEKDSKEINFIKESSTGKFISALNVNISNVKQTEFTKVLNDFFSKFNRQLNLVGYSFFIMFITYIIGAMVIDNQLENKIALTNESIANTNSRIQKIEQYDEKFKSLTNKYEVLIANIQNLNNANSEDKRYKNSIPNLLNNIMAIIPKGVQLTSIENTSNTHIVINAKSPKYEQIAFFKTKLKTDTILKNVVSDTGTMKDGYLSVTIEGELP